MRLNPSITAAFPTALACIALAFTPAATAQDIDPFAPMPNAAPTSLALQADGRILIVGSFNAVAGMPRNAVARLEADGSPDASFVDPGVDAEVKAIVVQPDGKLLIGGGFTAVGGQPRHHLARLDADGTLDATFADPGLDGSVWSIALQPDGRVLAGGDFIHVGAVAQNYVARFDANGALDASFHDPQLCCNVVRSVALQSDGHVLIGGFFSEAGGSTHFYLARYSASGTFDPSFPNVPAGVPITGNAIVVAPDDAVFVSGVSAQPVVKLDADGTYDPSFIAAPTDNGIAGMALQPDGKLLINGIFETAGGAPRHALARLDADGTLDAAFGDLDFSFDAANPNGYVYGIAAQADGRIVAVGNFTLAGGEPREHVARVTTGDYAASVLVVAGEGATSRVTWYRLGDGPELAGAPTLLHSTDGASFAPVGPMTRVPHGWQAVASVDVHGARFYLRAAGATSEGTGNGSAGQAASAIYSNDTIFGWGFE
ncbi:MAG TPA: hypothetical protein VJ724_11190 [Tahibacter sp.]|nr:hypothetical protein [Tahibacter sp.]